MKDSKTRTYNKKMICRRLFAAVMAMLLAFTAVPAVSVQAAAKKPKLSVGTKKTMYVGDTATLKVKNQPAKSKVTWTSSNKKIITVTKTGKLRAVKKGTATVICKVTAKTLKKPCIIKCKVTVKNTSQTVSTQSALQSALKNVKVDKITIKTDAEKTFTIPEGEYIQKKLVVDAPNADIVNYGVFADIQIKNIKKDTFFEKAQGNKFNILAEAARLVMDSGANVESVSVAKKNANVRIEVAKTAELGNVSVRAEAKVEIITEGTVGKIDVTKVSSVSLSGTTKGIEIVVTKDAEGAEIDTTVPVKIETVAEIKISLGKGAEGSTIFTGSVSVSVIIKNNTDEKVTVTNPDGKKEDVESGKEQTVNPDNPTPTNPTPTNPTTPSGGGGDTVTPTAPTVPSGGNESSGGSTTGSTSIALDPTEKVLQVGETVTLTATVTGAAITAITWKTSAPDVATVDNNGTVTALATGEAIITAAGGNKTASCTVTVRELNANDVEVLKAIIQEQNAQGARLSTDLNNGCYKWDEKGNLIEIDWRYCGVRGNLSLEGLASLTYFCCHNAPIAAYGQLSSLDVSKNVALTELICSGNQLSSLDVSSCTALRVLHCSDNQLSSLDVGSCTALQTLLCDGNQLSNLDVSKKTELIYLECGENQLGSLDVSGCTALSSLYCYGNQLSSLDVGSCTALQTLLCEYNQLSSLNINGCAVLQLLYCHNNQLNNLDVSGCTALRVLYCHDNQLSSLDMSDCIALVNLRCFNNQLNSLDASGCTVLSDLSCGDNQLSNLDVSGCIVLKSLSCGNNRLSCLDVSKITALTYLECGNNQLSSLDVSKNTALTYLHCSNNQLSSLDVSKDVALTSLDCGNNQLDSLDVRNNTQLWNLWCANNQLISLDVSNNLRLRELDYRDNPLTDDVDISNCSALGKLNGQNL